MFLVLTLPIEKLLLTLRISCLVTKLTVLSGNSQGSGLVSAWALAALKFVRFRSFTDYGLELVTGGGSVKEVP